MRITQAWVGCKFFRSAFLKKFGLENYNDRNSPAIFFGIYRPQVRLLYKHSGFVVIVWAGSDALQMTKNPTFIKYLQERTNRIKHIAISKFIANDLKSVSLPFYRMPITPHTNDDIIPVKKGSSIYFYGSPKDTKLYGYDLFDEVRKKLPGFKYYNCQSGTHTREQLIGIYMDCFIGLRFTSHDGLSNTATELGLMGRRIVWNGDTPNALPYKNTEDVIKHIINEARKDKARGYRELSNRMRKYLDISDKWMDTKFYK